MARDSGRSIPAQRSRSFTTAGSIVVTGANDVFALDVETRRHPLAVLGQARSRRSRPSAAAGPIAASASATARCSSARSTAGWSRSTCAPARKSGRCRPSAGRTASPSPARRCIYDGMVITGFCRRGIRRARPREGLRCAEAASCCGRSTRSRARANPATTPGPRTAMPGSAAAARCGRRRPSIPSWGCSISPPAIPSPDFNGAVRARRQSLHGLDRRHRSEAPASTAGISSRCTTTSGTTTRRIPSCCSMRASTACMRKGLAQVGKTGWAYILDRETGKPLIGIDERAGAAGAAAGDGGHAAVSARRCHRAAAGGHRAGRL